MTDQQIRLPPTPKIGEYPDGESKFTSWYGNSGYYRQPETNFHPYKSDKMISGGPTTDEITLNATLCGTMRTINKSKVVNNKKIGITKVKDFTKSQAMDTYIDHKTWSKKLLEESSMTFEEAFLQNTIDSNGDSVWIRSIAAIIKEVLGNDVPEFILDRFVALSRKYAEEGRITWMSFSNDVIPKVVNAVQAECQFRRELPALLKLMNRPRIVDPNIGALGDMSTNYRDFYKKATPIEFAPSNTFNYTRTAESSETALNAASKVLCAGTIKGTNQTPGYRGHIPRNVSNTRKLEHSGGNIVHPVDNNLRLTQRGMGAVLGYTGHIPHVIEGGNEERKTGCDPRTSNGAAYGPVRAFL